MASEQSYDCETPRLCANGCGFFGRAETRNLCSKCYRRACLEEAKQPASSSSIEKGTAVEQVVDSSSAVAASNSVQDLKSEDASSNQGKAMDRCGRCNKKVGLVKRFSCRCGNVYCSSHRHPEEHCCTFDFKSAGRELLAKANPVVHADKLERI